MDATSAARPAGDGAATPPPRRREPAGPGADRPSDGRVRLPVRVYSSGPDHDFDLADEADRKALYEIVLTEGTAADICRYLNLTELRRLWPTLWLPRHVRAAWGDRLTAAVPR